ncbi:MAG TPA: L,D-transpeptidase family protein [Steroidobacteraceae bacterium]|nr:L,D-transpeptidase family protein [Steroidobacteraceae bacterium]
MSLLLVGALGWVMCENVSAQASGALPEAIAAAIPSNSPRARKTSPAHGAAEALPAVYARSGDAPLWSRDGHASVQAEALVRELQDADAYGLEPRDYGAAALAQLMNAPPASAANDVQRWAQFDVRLSAAALGFMSDLHYGRVDPASAGFELLPAQRNLDLGAALESLVRSTDIKASLAAIEPPFYHYALLKAALPAYLKLAQQPDLTHLPAVSASLKAGDSYSGAPALRRLLRALGDLAPGSDVADLTFDADLSAGVQNFQRRHGLTADGVLGKGTFAALTTPLTRRVRQIDLTLERWRWLPPFQTPPIIVNIPQFRLFAFRTTEDRVADILQMDVIVGRNYPKQRTPVFESDMKYVVIRPYWDVPYSITMNEMLPKIRANPGYLAANRLEIVNGQSDSSPTVDPSPEAIEALAAGKLRLRQLPGEDNALGLIKFMFPNSYNVYLHSTPAHRLFNETVRAFSHGCIRVQDPLALATLVLKDAPGDWTRETIDAAMNGTKTVRVNLTQPITVLILYGTALATEAGPILFFDDIYGYDKRLERDLALAPAH